MSGTLDALSIYTAVDGFNRTRSIESDIKLILSINAVTQVLVNPGLVNWVTANVHAITCQLDRKRLFYPVGI